MRLLHHGLCGIAACVSLGAHCASTPDVTGIWFDPNDRGWGLTVVREGDSLRTLVCPARERGHDVEGVTLRATGSVSRELEVRYFVDGDPVTRIALPWCCHGNTDKEGPVAESLRLSSRARLRRFDLERRPFCPDGTEGGD